MSILDDLTAAVAATALNHLEFCTRHDYESDPEPSNQLCKATFATSFPEYLREVDDVRAVRVELAGSQGDVDMGYPVPMASIGWNGQTTEWDMRPWKCRVLAFMLLAAEAQARGDQAAARAFMDAADTAITEHCMEVEAEKQQQEPVYVVAEPKPAGTEWARVDSEVEYVQGGDPDGPLIPIDVYKAAQEAYQAERETAKPVPAPAFIVQHTTEAGHWQVGGVDPRYNGRSVDGHDYTDFDTAKRAAAVLNAAKAVFDAAPVDHHLTQTQPHPRAIRDAALALGVEPTDEEIAEAVKVVMS
jgi:hypothetical protein